MIVDFQHHFTPRELIKQDPGDRLIVHFDENDAPSYTIHSLLYDLDEHVRMMDAAGIDAAFLTSAAGMCASLEVSSSATTRPSRLKRDYPGRFIAAAHVHPARRARRHARAQSLRAGAGLPRRRDHLGDGRPVSSMRRSSSRSGREAERLGLFVFVHPALKLNYSQQFDGYDTARSVGREFSLVMATIRLINSGVFDRHPSSPCTCRISAAALPACWPRARLSGQTFWGVAGHARHGRTRRRTSTTTSATTSCSTAPASAAPSARSMQRSPKSRPSRIVFATDYPQEVRQREPVRDFVNDIRALGAPGEQILSGNVKLLLK